MYCGAAFAGLGAKPPGKILGGEGQLLRLSALHSKTCLYLKALNFLMTGKKRRAIV